MPRILFALVGSLGDVYPFLALAKALQRPSAGGTAWEIVIVAHPEFETAIHSHGFTFAPLKPSIVTAIKETPQGRALTQTNVHGAVNAANDFFEPLFKTWHQDIKTAHQLHKPDFVVLTTFPMFCGIFAIGDTPYVIMHTVPGCPTGEIAPATAGLGLSLPFAFLNRFVWSMGNKLMTKMYGGALSTLGPNGGPSPLPAAVIAKDIIPVLHVYSNALLPRCADWPPQYHVTGALAFNSPRIGNAAGNLTLEGGKKDAGSAEESSTEFDPPAPLATLLEDAEKNSIPVIYVGFGSMLSVAFEPPEAIALMQKIVSALVLPSTPKCLAIISTSGLAEPLISPPESSNGTMVHFSSIFIPHTWLFPRCSVIVHHGGAGTTHSAIRHSICRTGGITAAISVVIPCAVSSDQAFWGDIIYRAGLGPKPIPARSVTTVKLGKILVEVLQNDAGNDKGKKAALMKKKAGEMAVRMKAEDGVGKAVDIIEAYAIEKKVGGMT